MKTLRLILFFAMLFVVCPSVLGQKYTTKDWQFIDPPGATFAWGAGIYGETVLIGYYDDYSWEYSSGKPHISVYWDGRFTKIDHPQAVYGTWPVSIWESTIIGYYSGADRNRHYFKCNDDGTGFSDLTVTSVYSLRNQKVAGLESGLVIYTCNIDGTERTFFNAFDTTQTSLLCLGDNFIGGSCVRNYSTGLQTDGFVCDMFGNNWRTINPPKVVLNPSLPHSTDVAAVGDGLIFGSYFVCGMFVFSSGFICDMDGGNWTTIDAPDSVNGKTATGIKGRYRDKIVGVRHTSDGVNHAYIATVSELTPRQNAADASWRMYE